jgi:hypothetical protein
VSRLYRQFFTREECSMLDRFPLESAVSELSLLRILLVRVLAAAKKTRLTLKHRFSMLAAFCQAALTMASLARFEFKHQEPGPDLLDLLFPDDDISDLRAS